MHRTPFRHERSANKEFSRRRISYADIETLAILAGLLCLGGANIIGCTVVRTFQSRRSQPENRIFQSDNMAYGKEGELQGLLY
jgi:hypothetical protein